MIDARRETLISLKDVAARHGKSLAQVYSWVSSGLRAPGGKRAYLEVLKIGTYRTSEEALQRFFEAASPRRGEVARSQVEARRASREAARRCEAAGW